MTMDIKHILKKTSLGMLLNEDELEQLLKFGGLVSFHAGQTILHQGKKSLGMYIILQGSVLVTAKILGEGGTYIATLGKGNLVGEISLIEKGPCVTSALASTQVESLSSQVCKSHKSGIIIGSK